MARKCFYMRQSLPTRLTWNFATRSAAIATGLGIVFIIAFLFTHGLWFDWMQPGEKAKFWSDFAVAYGTICLAIVTWASVAETQQVILGEDRRFQQARVPMLRYMDGFGNARPGDFAKYWHLDGGELQLLIENIGDGPALDITARQLVMTAMFEPVGAIIAGQNRSSQPFEPTRNGLVTGFLAARSSITLRIPFSVPRGLNFDGFESQGVAVIGYYDAFGKEYITRYDNFGAEPQRFVREIL